MTPTPQPDDTGEATTNQRPAEGLRQQIRKIIGEMDVDKFEAPDGSGAPIVYMKVGDGLDEIMELVTAYAATVEREAAKKQATSDLQVVFDTYSGSISPDFAFELMKERLAALQGPIQGDSNTSEEASSTQ